MFSGCIDPTKAEEWIATLEKIFEVLQCTEREKARLAIYRLVGEANLWWEEIKGRKTLEEVQAVDWEAFKEMFMSKYFPQAKKVKMEIQLLELK